jgi:hypothetical protein
MLTEPVLVRVSAILDGISQIARPTQGNVIRNAATIFVHRGHETAKSVSITRTETQAMDTANAMTTGPAQPARTGTDAAIRDALAARDHITPSAGATVLLTLLTSAERAFVTQVGVVMIAPSGLDSVTMPVKAAMAGLRTHTALIA